MTSFRIALVICISVLAVPLTKAQEAVKSASPQGGAAVADCCNACKVAPGKVASEDSKLPQQLTDLPDVGALRDRFNADRGQPRMIALLSPTCPKCVDGAEWIQAEILKKYNDATLGMYVVWLPMLPTDARDRWNSKLIDDPRASHYWNGPRSVGAWFADNLSACPSLGAVAWDAIYIFDADASWDGDALAQKGCATPVYSHTAEIAEIVSDVIGGGKSTER